MNVDDEIERIARDGDPLVIEAAIDHAMRDPNLRAEVGRLGDLLIASKGHCHGEATQAADGLVAVIRGYLESQQRQEVAA